MSAIREELRKANPVDPEHLELSEDLDAVLWRAQAIAVPDEAPTPRVRLWRPTIAIGIAAATLVAIALIAFLPGSEPAAPADALGAVAVVAAAQEPAALDADEFIHRSAQTWTVGIPGTLFNGHVPSPQGPGSERLTQTEVYLNYNGGGDAETKQLDPPDGKYVDCTEPQVVLTYIVDGFAPCGRDLLTNEMPLMDERLGLPEPPSSAPFARDPLSATGSAVDDLPTDPAKLAATIDAAAAKQAAEVEKEGDVPASNATEAAAKLEIVAGILANPVGSPELRSAVFEYAKQIDGISIDANVTDPDGRTGTAISLDEPPRYAKVGIQGPGVEDRFNVLDEDTLVRRQLIFDPATSDVLATTVSLVRTQNRLLAPWLADVGAPALVKYETFDEPGVVTRPDLVMERVDCGGQTVIRRAGSNQPCPVSMGSLPPAVADEINSIFDRLRQGVTPAQQDELEQRLRELQRQYAQQPDSEVPPIEGGGSIKP